MINLPLLQHPWHGTGHMSSGISSVGGEAELWPLSASPQ
jgi:hypothetical protein